jgi:hypothetical protein
MIRILHKDDVHLNSPLKPLALRNPEEALKGRPFPKAAPNRPRLRRARSDSLRSARTSKPLIARDLAKMGGH